MDVCSSLEQGLDIVACRAGYLSESVEQEGSSFLIAGVAQNGQAFFTEAVGFWIVTLAPLDLGQFVEGACDLYGVVQFAHYIQALGNQRSSSTVFAQAARHIA